MLTVKQYNFFKSRQYSIGRALYKGPFILICLFLLSSCVDFNESGLECLPFGCYSKDWPNLPAPRNLTATAINAGLIGMEWGYDGPYGEDTSGFVIYRNGERIGEYIGVSFSGVNASSDSGVLDNTTYCYQVSAFNPGHESRRSNTACATTPPDTEPPVVPKQLTAAITSLNEVTLWWDQVYDNVDVAEYKIYRDGQYLKSVYGPYLEQYNDITTTDSIGATALHCYTLTARDYAGNESLSSNSTCVDNTWKIETLVSGSYIYNFSLAIDSANSVHITYYDRTYGELTYLTNAPGFWVFTVIDYLGTSYYSKSSIAVDSQNRVHISYQDFINNYLKYATNASGRWVSEILDDTGNYTGSYSSIVVDSLDKVHISYQSNGYLSYITNASGAWTRENVNSEHISTESSIDIDSTNKAHIAYQRNYATNNSGSWMVEYFTDFGRYPSLTIDLSDNVHICYDDNQTQYITNSTGSWVKQTINEQFYGGYYCSIKSDSANNLHISSQTEYSRFREHQTYGFRDLLYSTNQSGEWITYTVDTGNALIYNEMIGIDSSNKAHIIYKRNRGTVPGYDLMYATNSP